MTIVRIADNERRLDKAARRLAHAGFEDTIYDEAIVAGEPGNFGATVFSPGYGRAVALGQCQPKVFDLEDDLLFLISRSEETRNL